MLVAVEWTSGEAFGARASQHPNGQHQVHEVRNHEAQIANDLPERENGCIAGQGLRNQVSHNDDDGSDEIT